METKVSEKEIKVTNKDLRDTLGVDFDLKISIEVIQVPCDFFVIDNEFFHDIICSSPPYSLQVCINLEFQIVLLRPERKIELALDFNL